MLSQHAQFRDDKQTGDGVESVSVEAGLIDMLTRMEAGKFKVLSSLLDWFEEFRALPPQGWQGDQGGR